MASKPLALRYRRRLWQTLRATEVGAEKGLWNQGVFFRIQSCGTSCCFAGWAATVAKLTPKSQEDYLNDRVRPHNSRPQHVSDWACAWLGLSPQESSQLFSIFNTLTDLRRLVREFAGPEPKAGRR